MTTYQSFINPFFNDLPPSYLFPAIQRRVEVYRTNHPTADIISLGIGDVTRPLVPSVVNALVAAAQEMGTPEGQRGYGAEQGYLFLREAIATQDFPHLGITSNDIFVSDGSKCDSGNIQDLLSPSARIALADPTYPVYLDASVMAGHGGVCHEGRFSNILYLPCNEENGFLPSPPDSDVIPPNLIFLCSPNNPTGSVMPHELLEKWVQYAIKNNALILFDAAYSAYITNPTLPRSIYEIPHARKVALELRSFSKSAGFTGLRCAYMVVPEENPLHPLWKRRHATKFNGVAYPIQRAAAATYESTAQIQLQAQIAEYLHQASQLRQLLEGKKFSCFGGIDAPFLWWKIPQEYTSWEFFDHLLENYQIVTTPGSGFGTQGEGYIRLSAFARNHHLAQALARLETLFPHHTLQKTL